MMMKMLNLKLVMLLESQNTKTILQKAMFQIDLKKLLLLQKFKILLRVHILSKRFQKTNQKEFRVEKVIKRKGAKQYVKWKE